MPAEYQQQLVNTLPGLEDAIITQPGMRSYCFRISCWCQNLLINIHKLIESHQNINDEGMIIE